MNDKVAKVFALAVNLLPVMLAVATVITASQGYDPETGQPTHDAGIQAPFMALCAALMLLLNSFNWNGPEWQGRARTSLAGIFSVISAYLWIAFAIERHPLHQDVWGGLGLVTTVGFVAALIFASVIGFGVATKDD